MIGKRVKRDDADTKMLDDDDNPVASVDFIPTDQIKTSSSKSKISN